jgi:hypothetical protein
MHPLKHVTELNNTEKFVSFFTEKTFPLQMLVYINNIGNILISPTIPLVIMNLFSAQHSYLP